MSARSLPSETEPFEPGVRHEDGVPRHLRGVLAAERDAIVARRNAIFHRDLPDEPPGRPAPAPSTPPSESDTLAEAYRGAHEVRAFGVAFSGGGIRSATFNLGVLQGLADLGLLTYIDYLSTVSGGGYIGSWLHGVIRNRCHGDPEQATHQLSTHDHPAPFPPKDDPVTFLRKYSNYLAPRPGLFSADTWVMVLIWLRNVLLNQLILLPALAAVLLVPLTLVFFKQWPILDEWPWREWPWLLSVTATILALDGLFIALLLLSRNLRVVVRQTFLEPGQELTKTDDEEYAERMGWLIVPAVFVGAVLLGGSDPGSPGSGAFMAVVATLTIALVAMFGVFQWSGGFVDCYVKRHRHTDGLMNARAWAEWHIFWMVLVSAGLTAVMMVSTWRMPLTAPQRVAFAPVLICVALLAGATLLTGLMGIDYPDAAREWMARIGAMLAITCAAWAGLFLIAIFGPIWTAFIVGHLAPIGIAALGGWAASTIGGVLAGKSARTNSKDQAPQRSSLAWLIAIAPTLFMVGYLIFIALGVQLTLRRVVPLNGADLQHAQQLDLQWSQASTAMVPTYVAVKLAPAARFASQADLLLSSTPDRRLRASLLLMAGFLLVAIVASRRININEFSLHHFYKNRLVRCYLGASCSQKRKPNPLTGFDPADDFALAALLPSDPKIPYYGPYPIVNAALNLNAGSELAQQERKATSFIFTPTFSGFAVSKSENDDELAERDPDLDEDGYRHTRGYGFPDGPDVGTAMAISGAAANPNWGYHTSGAMAFLLTVFDARLGWWLGNPRRRDASRLAGPLFALKYLFYELLGLTTGRSQFVNLSDGGHFENLGLYELVRRRCRYIIVGDGEEDGGLTFESLGGAIRKCRADFGVEIDIDPTPIGLQPNGFSKAHCVVGTITYPETETARLDPICDVPARVATDKARGWILYIKSSLSGDEPADVIQYRSQHAAFPHESTGDQFFSESQFESYRRLGLHIVRDAFEDVRLESRQAARTTAPTGELLRTFQSLAQKWYAPIPVTPEAASRLANAYSELMRTLGMKEGLTQLLGELVPSFPPSSPPIPFAQLNNAAKAFLLEVIQLMQNVHTEFRLEHAANRSNPRNAGWMKVMHQWASSQALQECWTQVRDNYNPLFQDFISTQLVGSDTDVRPRP